MIATFILRTPRVRRQEARGHKMPTITCVGSSQPALYVIISSETAPGRVFRLLNQISSITFIVLLLHKSEKAKFVVQPDFFSLFLFSSGKQTIFCFSFIHASGLGVPKSPLLPLCNNKQGLESCSGVEKLHVRHLLIPQKYTFILFSNTANDFISALMLIIK